MSDLKIHFSCEPGKDHIEFFKAALIQNLGQAAPAEADVIVSIGGDGSLLHAFRMANKNQKVFGLVPPGSNSQGFWTNRGIENADMLINALGAAQEFKVHPLKADIYYSDGTSHEINAFNEVVPSENSGQAMLAELSVVSPCSTIGPIRIMGDGLIIATAFGSTALNRTYGGPAIDIRNSGIALVGKGIYEPKGGFLPVIAADHSQFEIKFLSPQKRPVRLQYDGKTVISDPQNPFDRISIHKNEECVVNLMLVNDPSARAFAAMMPV